MYTTDTIYTDTSPKQYSIVTVGCPGIHQLSISLIGSPSKKKGPLRESNPRPLPPKGSIIPLDQAAITLSSYVNTEVLAWYSMMIVSLIQICIIYFLAG